MVQGVDDVQPAVLQIIESEQPVQQPVEQPVQQPVEQPEQSTTRSGRVRRKSAWMVVDNKVWELVPKPANRKIISGKWHFVVKHGADGEILKYKARYVAKGFTQIFGVDYNETCSPTVRLTSLRVLSAIATQQKCLLDQMDIKMAWKLLRKFYRDFLRL